MKDDFTRRFGFLVSDVAKLYGTHFDRLARARLGLSRAQCRLLNVLATHDGDQPLSQAELAQRLDLSAMGVATLCDRMEAAGWVRRAPAPQDRRLNHVLPQPSAARALEDAMKISDEVQARSLAAFSADEREQLLALLRKARAGLLAWQDDGSGQAGHADGKAHP